MDNLILREDIDWCVENVARICSREKNQINDGFIETDEYITGEIRFSDNYWDFSSKKKVHQTWDFKYDFAQINSQSFRVTLKLVIIRELLLTNNRFPTTKKYHYQISRFIKYLESEKYIFHVKHITPILVKDYLKRFENKTKDYKFKIITAIKRFIEELEIGGYEMDYHLFQPIFKSISRAEISAESSEGKTANIPEALFKQIIKCAIEDMEDETLVLFNRIVACLIVILAHTGMRRSELRLLEANKLEEISIFNGKEKAYILNFFTYKTTGTKEGRWTKAKAYPDTVKAYRLLEKLTEEQRRKFKTNNMLLTQTGNVYGNTTLYNRLMNFFHRNQAKLKIDSLTDYERLALNEMEMSLSRFREYGEYKSKNWIGQKFYTVSPHQFRVAVANILKDRVTIEWIKEHMNHIYEDMTKHYFRDDEIIKQTILYRASNDGKKLEPNKITENELSDIELKEAYDTINKFLKKKKFNIYKDLEEILFIWKNNPLQESLVGLCRKAVSQLCERQDRLATFEKWYYLSPQFPDLKSFDFTLKRFMEKAKIVEHNKSLFESNEIYERAYQVEFTALKKFVENRLKPEYTLLKSILNEYGLTYVMTNYPNLKGIVNRLNTIDKEVEEWISKVNLKDSLKNELDTMVSANLAINEQSFKNS
ncbi:hypothetical protein [Bacillus sp. ISL-39]|uniref:hypothetical protein n=1 Tax=Bacillus sp. ISL-39 TaxID=2819124 RepID=UPI001BE9A29B|nr:hypothetical protein [Bacillus sp. ISL-39]MBT2636588.1 hypothetical protein [Bacillus sp. ISL-39]